MPHYFENVNLSSYPLYIMHVYDLLFFKDFDCNLFTSETMSAYHDFTECPFTKISAEHIMAYDFTFLGILYGLVFFFLRRWCLSLLILLLHIIKINHSYLSVLPDYYIFSLSYFLP